MSYFEAENYINFNQEPVQTDYDIRDTPVKVFGLTTEFIQQLISVPFDIKHDESTEYSENSKQNLIYKPFNIIKCDPKKDSSKKKNYDAETCSTDGSFNTNTWQSNTYENFDQNCENDQLSKHSKKINKTIRPKTTEKNTSSKETKNLPGQVRDKAAKSIRSTKILDFSEKASYLYHLQNLKSDQKNSSRFIIAGLEKINETEFTKLNQFIDHFSRYYEKKDPNGRVIKNEKHLEGVYKQCKEINGGDIFTIFLKSFIDNGSKNLEEWVKSFRGNTENKKYLNKDYLSKLFSEKFQEMWV